MKLSFEQLQVGQKLRCIEKPKKAGGYGLWCETSLTVSFDVTGNCENLARLGSYIVPKDTIMTVVEKNKRFDVKNIVIKLPDVILNSILNSTYNVPPINVKAGTRANVGLSNLRSFAVEVGDIVPMENALKQYKIFYEGKAYKPKYFADLGKIKASLLISFGYYKGMYELWYNNYRERTPELDGELLPDWIDTDDVKFSRDACKKIEIFEFINHDRKNPIKVDFDVQKYYDEMMRVSNVTAQFGAAAREVFKNMSAGEYSYMLIFVPSEYREGKNNYIDWKSLKESDRIKSVLKSAKVKGSKKSTKYGKTAIAFKNLEDLKQVMLRLEPKEYYILDCDGDQLIEKNARFVKLLMLKEVSGD